MVFLVRTLALVVFLAGTLVPAFPTEPDPMSAVEGFVDALSHADLDALLPYVAEDATFFAPLSGSPQRVEGLDDIAAMFESFFARIHENADGPVDMKLVPRDLQVQNLGDAAIVTFHIGKILEEPQTESYSFSRRSFVLRFQEGQWKIAHLHGSNVIIQPSVDESK